MRPGGGGVAALALCVWTLAGAIPCFGSAASGLTGFVVDRGLRPLPGATVTVTDRHRDVSRTVVTGPRGEFRAAPLDPGDAWEVRVAFPGMATQVVGPVVLAAGGFRELTLILVPESEVRERVTITAAGPVLSPDASTDTRLSSEFTELLPILGRNYQDVLTLAPGVSDIDGDGNPNIHGARDTDVRTLVDGVSTVNPYTGRVGQQLNIESIQELEIKTAGAGAEFGRAQGGFVNVVTRSGGNEFEGAFKFFWRGSRLDGDGAGADDPRLHGGLGERDLEFDDVRAFLSAGGPIRRDRAWYFLSGEIVRREDPISLGLQPFVHETHETRIFGKVSWQVTPAHKLVLSAILDPQRYVNDGIDSLTAVESGYTRREGGTNLVLRETVILSPLAFLETTVQRFVSRPGLTPSVNPDTNGNGVLFFDRNDNGLMEAVELDPGEDWDADGAWDVFEADWNANEAVDPAEDRDDDGRFTVAGIGCEGETREDRDCDGVLDAGEDANDNGRLDDRPRPQADDIIPGPDGTPLPLPPHYPYPRLRPLSPDRLYLIDARDRTSGPFYQDASATLGRVTLHQDLNVSVPDRRGQHDLKIGGIVERENYREVRTERPVLVDDPPDRRDRRANGLINFILPAEGSALNRAGAMTTGIYAQDTWRPRPGLVFNLGLRLEREATDS
ncbi:MAG: carboxypeptidase regulatory-like domain-containing protein, partial [Actinomycetota bacterium]